jgi:hypothetical protein
VVPGPAATSTTDASIDANLPPPLPPRDSVPSATDANFTTAEFAEVPAVQAFSSASIATTTGAPHGGQAVFGGQGNVGSGAGDQNYLGSIVQVSSLAYCFPLLHFYTFSHTLNM